MAEPSGSAPDVRRTWGDTFLSLAILSPIVAHWGLVKTTLFKRFEYTSDLFSIVQLSRSALDGRPWLSDNAFGSYAGVHNYYTVLVFAPLTLAFGAYGLFVSYLLLLLAAAHYAIGLVRGPATLVVGVLIFGPVAFWIWDNPVYGFHAETFIMPVGLLFAAALAAHSRLRWPLLVALCALHEQGALVAMGIHVVFLTVPTSGTDWRPLFRQVARVVAGYAALFVAGMLLLYVLSPDNVRAWHAWRSLVINTTTHPAVRDALIVDVINRWRLMLPVVAGAVILTGRLRTLLGLVVALLPLVVVAMVGRAAYGDGGHNALGLTWPPRVVGGWTVGTAAVIYALRGTTRWSSRRLWPAAIAAAVLLGVYQDRALLGTRNYAFVSRFTTRDTSGSLANLLLRSERRALACVSETMGPYGSIAASEFLFTAFHRNLIVWPTRLAAAWRPPDVVICEVANRFPPSPYCETLIDQSVSTAQFEEMRLSGLRVAYSPSAAARITACLRPQPGPRGHVPTAGLASGNGE